MANSKRKCVYCKERFLVELGTITPKGFFCSMKHLQLYCNNKRPATIKKINNEEKKKFKLTDKPFRKSEAQKAFNSFIRKRDEKNPCISCPRTNNPMDKAYRPHQRHASHYRSVGSCAQLRFNELNVHASCAQCNSSKSGNIIEYRIRLIKKISEETVLWLESQNEIAKYSCDDYLAIEKKYKLKLKELNDAD